MKTFVLLFVIGVSFLTSCEKDEASYLSDQEKADLLFLREEEKLARDVYLYSYNLYNQIIFSNISNSEQSHMNGVLFLLNKYELVDPVTNNAVGIFSNSELQSLYNQLTAISDISLSKALEVGANIEDLDINDISIFVSHTSKTDLLEVYDNLACGSRNHFRSFVAQLGTYTPIYINQSEYDNIISSSQEQCGN
ncbi:DUF2202 domain-containing protein [Mangrovimonas sp. DI 80]|uniref:DUF2202 domain-containing protein n=1 Tax=Mangrovimonas sp. DI 80 TaxID=1779330 RepID=UPI000977E12F|nr:DUF2202 domain-containing protein [Mangrovimonas sp. DI 80]OMP30126.1 hypothetical protein BKM32_12105 [Mangrovimonas sp. DI 80]